jgi:hypothetical protein
VGTVRFVPSHDFLFREFISEDGFNLSTLLVF